MANQRTAWQLIFVKKGYNLWSGIVQLYLQFIWIFYFRTNFWALLLLCLLFVWSCNINGNFTLCCHKNCKLETKTMVIHYYTSILSPDNSGVSSSEINSQANYSNQRGESRLTYYNTLFRQNPGIPVESSLWWRPWRDMDNHFEILHGNFMLGT